MWHVVYARNNTDGGEKNGDADGARACRVFFSPAQRRAYLAYSVMVFDRLSAHVRANANTLSNFCVSFAFFFLFLFTNDDACHDFFYGNALCAKTADDVEFKSKRLIHVSLLVKCSIIILYLCSRRREYDCDNFRVDLFSSKKKQKKSRREEMISTQ